MINIAIADDHALIREGLSKILSYEKDLNIVAESSSGEDLIKKIEGIDVDIVLFRYKYVWFRWNRNPKNHKEEV